MKLDEIEARIENRLKELCGETLSSAGSAAWVLAGGDATIDSVLCLRLALAIEEEFGIVVADHEINKQNFASLNHLARFVERTIAD